MKNLLIITQKVDTEDDLLGFFVDWIREFAKHFDEVFVLTLAKGNYQLPSNVFVYSLGKEKGTSKLIRFFKFYFYFFKLVFKSNGIFVHMSPVFAIASWPAAVLFRKKIILWYLHRSVTMRLKIAERLCYKIATAVKESLRIKSRKIVETGHGINIAKFKTDRNWISRPLKILSIGRVSKIKNYDTLLEAAKILKDRGLDFNLKIIGRPVMKDDFGYFESLKRLVQKFDLTDFVEFVGFVPYSRIAGYYKEADIFVNLSPTGGIDKVVLEAMAAGSLVVVANQAFVKYFGKMANQFFFEYGNPDSLFDRLLRLYGMDVGEKKNTSEFLSESAKQNSVEQVVNKIAALF